jgi:hypothetical protein
LDKNKFDLICEHTLAIKPAKYGSGNFSKTQPSIHIAYKQKRSCEECPDYVQNQHWEYLLKKPFTRDQYWQKHCSICRKKIHILVKSKDQQ